MDLSKFYLCHLHRDMHPDSRERQTMNDWAVTIILSITATASAAIWGFVLGIYHRLRILEAEVEKLKETEDAEIH